MAREDHWYVPGKHAHEKQHKTLTRDFQKILEDQILTGEFHQQPNRRHEYTTLQIMQRYALDGDHDNFVSMLLSYSPCQNKRNEAARLCGYKGTIDAMEKSTGV